MPLPGKTSIVALVSAVTIPLGVTPASAAEPAQAYAPAAEVTEAAASIGQSLSTSEFTLADESFGSTALFASSTGVPHNFDVEAAIALAESEIGTSRPTGWSQPGECIMSAQRWIRAGGGAWAGGGDPVTNYAGATRLRPSDAQPGDVIQYENIAYPNSWVTGVHTLLVTGVNDDGTFTIIESNVPNGSGLVSKIENWTPAPPDGFQAVAWRF